MTDLARFRAERLAALTAEDGWLNLTDRVEIAPGRFSVGSAADCDVRLSVGPGLLGVLELSDALEARFTLPGEGAQAFVAGPETPPRLRVPPLLLELHVVEGQPALRVRLLDDPRRKDFAGIEAFPDDPAWVIDAAWEALAAPLTRQVETVKGIPNTVTQTHVARFTHEGQEVSLVPLHLKGGKPMFVIRDATSGRETYGAARFLLGEVTGDRVRLDFNRAHNPPCAFTEFAVCPLPPPENRLPFAIRAGELAPRDH